MKNLEIQKDLSLLSNWEMVVNYTLSEMTVIIPFKLFIQGNQLHQVFWNRSNSLLERKHFTSKINDLQE